jgi:hypothetical protein
MHAFVSFELGNKNKKNYTLYIIHYTLYDTVNQGEKCGFRCEAEDRLLVNPLRSYSSAEPVR